MDYRAKMIKTVLLALIYMSKGLHNELFGPAMIDLKLIFNTNYASLTRAIAGRGIGGIIGALMGGVVADKFEKRLDLCNGVFSVTAGAVVVFIPIAPSVDYLWYLYFGLGISTGVVNICCTRLILDIWKESNTGVLQIIHMAFGIGALLTPLICSPFLATSDVSVDNNVRITKESRVQVAFYIVAIVQLVISIPFFFIQSDRTSSNTITSQKAADSTSVPTSRKSTYLELFTDSKINLRLVVVFSLIVYYFNFVGCEKVFVSFVRTFSVDALQFDAIHASYLNTLFWVSFTLGRLLTSFISGILHIRTLIAVQAIVHLGSVTFLKYQASKTASLFWVGTFMEGFTMSPLYGLGVSLVSTQMEMSGMLLTVVDIAGCIGDWTYLKTSGGQYDIYGPSAILSLVEMAAWILAGATAMLWITSRKNQTVQ